MHVLIGSEGAEDEVESTGPKSMSAPDSGASSASSIISGEACRIVETIESSTYGRPKSMDESANCDEVTGRSVTSSTSGKALMAASQLDVEKVAEGDSLMTLRA